jgi:hypothetical protein
MLSFEEDETERQGSLGFGVLLEMSGHCRLGSLVSTG